MEFNGTTGYFDCGDVSVTEGLAKISISMMINFNVIDPPNNNNPIKKGTGGFQTLRILNWNSDSGRLLFDTADGVTGGGGSFDLSGFSTGVWYHLVFTKDSSTNPDIITAYMDGVSQSITSFGSTNTGPTASTADALTIGRDLNSASRFFDGKMAYIAIYNDILSQSDVDELRFKPDSIVDGRVAYWPLLTTACKDLSGNSNDGTLNGGVTASFDGPPVYFPQLKG